MKKTIIYVIIVLMLGSMFASALPFSGKNNSNEIVLQCIGQEASETLLKQSALIMENRLKSIGIQTNAIEISSDPGSIEISFKEEIDLGNAARLLCSKGELGFFETGDRNEVVRMLQGEDELLRILNASDSKHLPAAIFGVCERSELVKVTELLKGLDDQDLINAGILFAWGASPVEQDLWQLYILKGEATIDASNVEKASVEGDKRTGSTYVMIDLDQRGGQEFQDLTKRSVSKAVAIVLDNIVYSAPVVQEAISGGKCMISGKFSDNEAAQLAAIIDSGELPLDFKVLK